MNQPYNLGYKNLHVANVFAVHFDKKERDTIELINNIPFIFSPPFYRE